MKILLLAAIVSLLSFGVYAGWATNNEDASTEQPLAKGDRGPLLGSAHVSPAINDLQELTVDVAPSVGAGEILPIVVAARLDEHDFHYRLFSYDNGSVIEAGFGTLPSDTPTEIQVPQHVYSGGEFSLRLDALEPIEGTNETFVKLLRFFARQNEEGYSISRLPFAGYESDGLAIPMNALPPRLITSSDGDTASSSEESFAMSSAAQNTFKTCYVYNTKAEGPDPVYKYGVYGTLEVWEPDYANGQTVDLGSDGCASVTFTPYDPNGDGVVELKWAITFKDGRMKAGYGLVAPDRVIFGPVFVSVGSYYEIGSAVYYKAGASAARAYNYAQHAWDYAASTTPGTGPFIDVTIYAGITSPCGGRSCYLDPYNEIMLDGDDDLDPWIVAHEFAHSFQDKYYSVYLDYAYHSRCNGEGDYSIGWQEGHANFFASRTLDEVDPELSPRWSAPKSSASSASPCSSTWQPGDTSDEATVEKVLYDMVDGVLGNDKIDVPDSYITDVLKVCEPLSGSDSNHDGLLDFYKGSNGSGCDYLQAGKYACYLVSSAFLNNVDYRVRGAYAFATAPSSAAWKMGDVTVSSGSWQASDCPLRVDLGIDSSSSCSSPDAILQDSGSPYSQVFSLASYASGTNVYGCARPVDDITTGPWDASPSYFRVDNTYPETTLSLNGHADPQPAWFNTNVQGYVWCSDAHSGVAKTEYHTGTGTYLPYTFPVLYATEGANHVFYARCTDNVDRWFYKYQYFGIDYTKPTSSIAMSATSQLNGWYSASPTAYFTCSDALSQCNSVHYRYRTNGGAWTDYIVGGSRVFGEGIHDLETYSFDHAGNQADVKSKTIKVDLAAPQLSVALDGQQGSNGWYTGSVQVTITCTDASPVTIVGLRDGAASGTAWLEAGQGSHEASATCTDAVGREAQAAEPFEIDSIVPDTTPTFVGTAGNDDWFISDVSVSLDCSDGGSGCASTTYRLETIRDPGADSSGNGRDATLLGPTATTGVAGDGLSFDGINDYLRVDSPGLPGNDFTYMGWVKPTASHDLHMFMAANGLGKNEIILKVLPNHQLGLWLDNVKYDASIAGATLPADQWSHIAFVREGSTIRTYVNGVMDKDFAWSWTTLSFSTCPLLIGTDVDSGCTDSLGNWAQGGMDELRIYDRALPATEITAAKDGNAPVVGMTAEWSFTQPTVGAPTGYTGTPFVISEEGSTELHYSSVDAAGNAEPSTLSSVKLDRIPPTSTVSTPTEAKKSDYIYVSWTSADYTSGVKCVRVEVRPSTSSTWSTTNPCGARSGSNTYTGSPGTTYHFRTQATDAAGNLGAYSQETSTYVNHPPVADAGPDQSVDFADQYVNGVEVDASGSSDPDGSVNWYCFQWGDGSSLECGLSARRSHKYEEPTGTPVRSQPYTVTVTARDNDGRTDTDTARISVTTV